MALAPLVNFTTLGSISGWVGCHPVPLSSGTDLKKPKKNKKQEVNKGAHVVFVLWKLFNGKPRILQIFKIENMRKC